MVEIRSFLNSDVPALVELWNRQGPVDGRLARATPAMFETHVFSKAYFDPLGLMIAEAKGHPIGAALCGFAPTPDGKELDLRCGVLCHTILNASAPPPTAIQLWSAATAYFSRHGAQTVFAGSRFPDSPFLSGLCGGTFVPGIVAGDHEQVARFREYGFVECGAVDVLRLDVASFKPPIDRRAIMARRMYDVRLTIDPQPDSWWQHNQAAFRHQLDFRLVERKSNRVCGFVALCNSRPQDAGWDARYFGISQIQVSAELQRSGLGQALLFDAIKDLGQRGVTEIEAQVPRSNAACQSMLQRIGFRLWYTAAQARRNLSDA